MKRGYIVMIALALCVVFAQCAPAQTGRGQGRGGGQGRFGGGGLTLLAIPEVQKELKMTPEQVDKVQAKQAVTRQTMQDAGGAQGLRNLSQEDRQKLIGKMQEIQKKAVSEILNADQQKRFRQLELQQAGPGAFARKDVADELKLTKEQSDKISAIQREQQQATRNAREGIDIQNMSDEDRQKLQAKTAEIQKASHEKVVAVLTAEQQKQWKEMTGEPFKFPARGRGRRPRP